MKRDMLNLCASNNKNNFNVCSYNNKNMLNFCTSNNENMFNLCTSNYKNMFNQFTSNNKKMCMCNLCTRGGGAACVVLALLTFVNLSAQAETYLPQKCSPNTHKLQQNRIPIEIYMGWLAIAIYTWVTNYSRGNSTRSRVVAPPPSVAKLALMGPT